MCRKTFFNTLFLSIVFVLALSCTMTLHAESKPEIRALWVTRWDYSSPGDVTAIFSNARTIGFNTVFFQVRGEATAFYRSTFEPWAWELNNWKLANLGKDPGWDPLVYAIKAARKNGIEIHAYMNVLPGWHGSKKIPEGAKQLWNTHRDWFMVDKSGSTMAPEDFYCFLNPALPEVKNYLVKIFSEVAARYPVDGIHLDYIRYPEEKGDFSYDARSIELFKKETGVIPSTSKRLWNKWRSKQITDLVKRISFAVKKIRPGIKLSASLIGNYEDAQLNHHQQGFEWMQMGLIDLAVPMLYMRNKESFVKNLKGWVKHRYGTKLLAGIWVNKGKEVMLDQIAATRSLDADGISIFAYSELFKSHKENDLAQTLRRTIFYTPH